VPLPPLQRLWQVEAVARFVAALDALAEGDRAAAAAAESAATAATERAAGYPSSEPQQQQKRDDGSTTTTTTTTTNAAGPDAAIAAVVADSPAAATAAVQQLTGAAADTRMRSHVAHRSLAGVGLADATTVDAAPPARAPAAGWARTQWGVQWADPRVRALASKAMDTVCAARARLAALAADAERLEAGALVPLPSGLLAVAHSMYQQALGEAPPPPSAVNSARVRSEAAQASADADAATAAAVTAALQSAFPGAGSRNASQSASSASGESDRELAGAIVEARLGAYESLVQSLQAQVANLQTAVETAAATVSHSPAPTRDSGVAAVATASESATAAVADEVEAAEPVDIDEEDAAAVAAIAEFFMQERRREAAAARVAAATFADAGLEVVDEDYDDEDEDEDGDVNNNDEGDGLYEDEDNEGSEHHDEDDDELEDGDNRQQSMHQQFAAEREEYFRSLSVNNNNINASNNGSARSELSENSPHYQIGDAAVNATAATETLSRTTYEVQLGAQTPMFEQSMLNNSGDSQEDGENDDFDEVGAVLNAQWM